MSEQINEALLECDYSSLHELSLMESETEEKHYYIRGKFATIGQINNNRRIYPRHLWEREVAKYQDVLNSGSVNTLMEWEHPKGRTEVDPKLAVAKITKLWIEGDYVMGEAVIFDNPIADNLKSMIKHGVKISVSSRARGSVGAGGVVDKFDLITFDIVTKPSDQAATMSGIYESEEDLNMDTTNDALYENLLDIMRSKNSEISDLNEEIELLKQKIAEYEIGVGHTDVKYHDNDGRHFRPYDNEETRYDNEETEYELRRHSNFRDIGGMRHQDVSSTLVDTDPSGYYASGETEDPKVPRLFRGFGRADVVGADLGKDLFSTDDLVVPGASGDVENTPVIAESFDEEMLDLLDDIEAETHKILGVTNYADGGINVSGRGYNGYDSSIGEEGWDIMVKNLAKAKATKKILGYATSVKVSESNESIEVDFTVTIGKQKWHFVSTCERELNESSLDDLSDYIEDAKDAVDDAKLEKLLTKLDDAKSFDIPKVLKEIQAYVKKEGHLKNSAFKQAFENIESTVNGLNESEMPAANRFTAIPTHLL